jgi:AcrR family transcriptional regulator
VFTGDQPGGVERLTVYRHFADEGELFAACSAHFHAETPDRDPTTWADVVDPVARLRAALLSFYDYYRRGEDMIANAQRDAPQLPALAAVLAPRARLVRSVRDDLIAAWQASDDVLPRLAAAIGHALRFDTWRSLVRREGLDDASAAELMIDLVRAAASPEAIRRTST